MSKFKIQFKSRFALVLMICAILAACGPDNSAEEDSTPSPVTSDEFSALHLGSADNVMLGAANGPSASAFALHSTVQNSGVSTVDATGSIQDVTGDGLKNKRIEKFLKIKKNSAQTSKIKAALKLYDSDKKLWECHFIDKNDKAHKLKKCPKKSHRLKEAAVFYEDHSLYFVDESADLIKLDISDDVSRDAYQVVKNNVQQVVRGKNGDWMIAYSNGQVKHVNATGDIETRMDDILPTAPDNAEANKLFMTNKNGFFFQGDGHWCNSAVFFRALWNQNQISVTSAHANDNAQVCFYPYSNPNICSLKQVADKELLLCGEYVYQLGYASNDTKAVDFLWTGLAGGNIKIVVSSQYIYYFSHDYDSSTSDNGARLTRIDPQNSTCNHLFSRNNTTTCVGIVSETEYIIDQLTATPDDIVRFCGNRVGSTQKYLVEIKDAGGASPTSRETPIERCDQLENL